MDPLRLSTTLKQGDNGPEVKLVQEWLNLRGITLNITSVFGAPTEAAVLDFCAAQRIDAPQPFVDAPLFQRLISPMLEALSPVPAGDDVRETLVTVAERQLAQSPREVGGSNCGPWVRLYMRGKEGAAQLWGAGFVSYCLERACEAMGARLPFATSTSVADLLAAAMKGGRRAAGDPTSVRPGDLFVARLRQPSRWVHTGVVRAVDGDGFDTIEGDASPTDGRDGDRVMSKRRSFDDCDFLKTTA
jgi:hypothetical protein